MKTLFKAFFLVGFALVALAVLLGWGAIHVLGDVPGVHLQVNGDEVIWSGLDLFDALGAGLGLVITLGVMCLVVPLVLLLGLGLPLLILGALALAGIAALLGVGALVGSPLIVIGLIVWLLVRDKKPRHPPVTPMPAQAPPASATSIAPTPPGMPPSPNEPSFHA